jgi:hypothetical protein
VINHITIITKFIFIKEKTMLKYYIKNNSNKNKKQFSYFFKKKYSYSKFNINQLEEWS